MGSSGSTLRAAGAFRSLLSESSADGDKILLLLEADIPSEDQQPVMPFALLRVMRHYYTKNFAKLFFSCVKAVAQIRTEVTNFPGECQDGVQKLLNALRLMRRMLPFSMESGDTCCILGTDQFTHGDGAGPRCWNGEESVSALHPPLDKAKTKFTETFVQSFFVQGRVCDESDPGQKLPMFSTGDMFLGKFLIRLLVDCCFTKGLGLPLREYPCEDSEHRPHVSEPLLWYPYLGECAAVSSSAPCSATIHIVRCELLSTIVTCLARPLFSPSCRRDTVFTEPLLSCEDVPLLPTLMASALNGLLSCSPHCLAARAGHLPNQESEVLLLCARFLCCVFCYPGFHSEGVAMDECRLEESTIGARTCSTNGAREFARLITPKEAHIIVLHLRHLFSMEHFAYQTASRGSPCHFAIQDECVMLLWRLIELSPECLNAFGRQSEVLCYVAPLVAYAMEAREDTRLYSRLQLVLFTLMRLTQFRSFSVLCNSPIAEDVSDILDGCVHTYSDLVIGSLCTLLLNSRVDIRPLHGMCTVVLSNMCPHVTSMSEATSEKFSLVLGNLASSYLGHRRIRSLSSGGLNGADATLLQVVLQNVLESIFAILHYQKNVATGFLVSLIRWKTLLDDIAEETPTGDDSILHQLPAATFLLKLRDILDSVGDAPCHLQAPGSMLDPIVLSTQLRDRVQVPSSTVKRFLPTQGLEEWTMKTYWASLYSRSAPGTMGDSASVKMFSFD
uniref:Dymeclin n=1 Tax=Trypanosoma vivax (strain Y486) TaxID=1055687 RepID=G0TZL1_TRYVY|nr:conserved hypothetical protein [Trypanosoma vivax Y486]